jgi:hypothetical protein
MTFPNMPDPTLGNDQQATEYTGYEEQQESPLPNQPIEEEVAQPLPAEEEQPMPVSPEAQLPPEARGETNGGPLGCCLGITIGLLFSIFIGVIGFGHNLAYVLGLVLPFNALTDIRLATGLIALIGTVLFAYFGWKIGKRIYREYEPPVIKVRSKKRKSRPKAKKPRLDPYKNF